MVTLNRLQAWEGGMTEYTVSGVDAWRILRHLEPFTSARIDPVLYVTVYSKDLTNETLQGNFEEGGRHERAEEADLFACNDIDHQDGGLS